MCVKHTHKKIWEYFYPLWVFRSPEKNGNTSQEKPHIKGKKKSLKSVGPFKSFDILNGNMRKNAHFFAVLVQAIKN